MKNLNINLPVGILPVGTANDFAHSLGLEFDIKKAVENIINSKPRNFDIGKINDTELHCKDMDNFVSWYDPNDVRDILLDYRNSREDIEILNILILL